MDNAIRDFISPDTDYWRTAQLPGGTYASWGIILYQFQHELSIKKKRGHSLRLRLIALETQVAALEFGTFPSSVEAQQAPENERRDDHSCNQKARLILA
ncbi:hypothetical protein O9929_12590 [Vibrio lentus]|nr:hypothetical protein [Vibrio lentus]